MSLLKKCEYASSQAGNLKMAMKVTSSELTSGGKWKMIFWPNWHICIHPDLSFWIEIPGSCTIVHCTTLNSEEERIFPRRRRSRWRRILSPSENVVHGVGPFFMRKWITSEARNTSCSGSVKTLFMHWMDGWWQCCTLLHMQTYICYLQTNKFLDANCWLFIS